MKYENVQKKLHLVMDFVEGADKTREMLEHLEDVNFFLNNIRVRVNEIESFADLAANKAKKLRKAL